MLITLSDGNSLVIKGNEKPTLDIRAGVDPTVISDSFLTGEIFAAPDFDLSFPPLNLLIEPFSFSESASSADITIDSIAVNQPDGLVFLTNQYEPNSAPGKIEVSSIRADGRNRSSNPGGFLGNGGDVIIDSRSGITLEERGRIDVSSRSDNAGNITLFANEAVAPLISSEIISEVISKTDKLVGSGDINITSKFGSVELRGSSNGPSGLFANNRGAGEGGNVKITAERLIVQDGSTVSAQSFGQGNAGTVNITASEAVEVIGTGIEPDGSRPRSSLLTGTAGGGAGGSLAINTGELIVQDGARVSTSTAGTLGNEPAGNLTVVEAEAVKVIGTGTTTTRKQDGSLVLFTVQSALSTQTSGPGAAGELEIQTEKLMIQDGAVVSTATLGKGAAGKLTVEASAVEVIGTGTFILKDGSLVTGSSGLTSQTVGRGAGGELEIKTDKLIVRDGAAVSTETSGEGAAGKLTVTDSELVELSGTSADGINSGLFANTTSESTGDGGSIFIDPRTMIIRDGARVAVNSDGGGIGGDIEIFSGSLTLDNGAEISAETRSTLGGDITLQIDDDPLLLRNVSKISTTAGTAQAGGNGGDIIINAPFIIAFPSEDSDITANAFEGDGGNVTIDTNSLFGIEFRDQETKLSDITASSEFGRQGEVEINTSGIDPTRGLLTLPEEAVNTEISQGCQTVRGKEAVEYFEIGRGGSPPTPDDPLNADTAIEDWIPLEQKSGNGSESDTTSNSPHATKAELMFPCAAQ